MKRSEERAARKLERTARRNPEAHSLFWRASLLIRVGAGIASHEDMLVFRRLPFHQVARRRREHHRRRT